MICNIPNRFTKRRLMSILDQHCAEENDKLAQRGGRRVPKSEYDFLYLPVDFRTKFNKGYAFVNMTSAPAARRLHAFLHGHSWAAIGSGKVCEVVHSDIQCNVVLSTCYTPLTAALSTALLKCVKLLIKAGADVKGLGSANPLVIAASEGLTDCLKLLLDAGAYPNVPDDFGHLPIELAASNNSREDVKILLPVTSRIPPVRDWSIDGIITYVKSTVVDKDVYKIKPNKMKLEGNKAYKRKDYHRAATLYSLALNYYPDDATLLSNTSACWLNIDDGDKALTDAQLWRMMRPDWSKACFREGAAQMLLKEYGKACDAFLDGLKLDPANSDIESALREAFNSLKIGGAAKKGH